MVGGTVRLNNDEQSNIIVNIMCTNYHECIKDVAQHVGDRTPKVQGYVVRQNKISEPLSIMLDSGASYSCLNNGFYRNLYENGFADKLMPTARQHPTVANASTMSILGDVILTIRFYDVDRYLECQNVRFSVFEHLSTPCIIGIEVLKITELKIDREQVFLSGLRVPEYKDGVYVVEMDVIDAVVYDDAAGPRTITSL